MTEARITAADAFHIDVENDHVGCLWLLNRPVHAEALVALAGAAMAAVPRLSMMIDRRRRVWRHRPEIDPAGQVVTCPASKNLSETLGHLSRAYLEPLLQAGRPPWRVVHLPGAEGNGDAVCYIAHHSFTDGSRGFELARSFASGHLSGRGAKGSTPPNSMNLGVWRTAAVTALRDVTRATATGIPKGRDTGTRRFETAEIPAEQIRAARGAAQTSISDILAGALARAVARCYGGDTLNLMVPRAVGDRVVGSSGNAFLPEIRTYDAIGTRRDKQDPRNLVLRVTADQFLMSAMQFMPARLRQATYHRWADGFDALCTVLPDRFADITLCGAQVRRAYGVPPLIWRQPISAAFVCGKKGAALLVAWDNGIIDASGLSELVAKEVACITRSRQAPPRAT